MYRSEQTARLLLIMCVWGIFPLPVEQLPVREGFNLLLYPVSVMGPYGSHTALKPVTGTEQITQRSQNPQANHSKISPQSLSKPLHANSAFLQPDPVHGPDLHTVPSESLVMQEQMSSFIPMKNIPQQVYLFVQQAAISDSGSSEEGAAAQVIYMVPVSVDSPNMSVMEGNMPNPDPGHLQVPASTPAVATAARLDAQGQLGKTVGTERAMQTRSGRERPLTTSSPQETHQLIRK
ncbi:uncharacterized protein si:ch211-149b19.4 [Carassius carassius]|uniref:uncharacterized protein si:ch211-149b19.4 n=1 Tax=Carassius carassius TaxID=217509 RepID=UPI0028691A0B|nr:uncharacterized protein si:ch211-149b19.4 [Carassius carassius]